MGIIGAVKDDQPSVSRPKIPPAKTLWALWEEDGVQRLSEAGIVYQFVVPG